MLNFIGNFSISGVTDVGSIAILKTFAWISFVLLFIASVPMFIFYTILQGSKNQGSSHPLEILKGIACWLIIAPIGLIMYVMLASLTSGLTTATTSLMDSSSLTMASNFSWLVGFLCIALTNAFPFYYILRGYGQLDMGTKQNNIRSNGEGYE